MDIKNIKDFSVKGKVKRIVVINTIGKKTTIETIEDLKERKGVKKVVNLYKLSRKEQEAILIKAKVKFDKKDNEADLVKKIANIKK